MILEMQFCLIGHCSCLTDYTCLKLFTWWYLIRQTAFFKELWDGLGDSVSCLRLVAVSTEPFPSV